MNRSIPEPKRWYITDLQLISPAAMRRLIVDVYRDHPNFHRLPDSLIYEVIHRCSERFCYAMDVIDRSFWVVCPECEGGQYASPYANDPCDECLGHGEIPLSRIVEDASTNSFLKALRGCEYSKTGLELAKAAKRLDVPDCKVILDYAVERWPHEAAMSPRWTLEAAEDMEAYHQLIGDFTEYRKDQWHSIFDD